MKDFKKEKDLNEVKELREAYVSFIEIPESSLKAFIIYLIDLQFVSNISRAISVTATIQIFHELGSHEKFGNKDETTQDCITLKKKTKGRSWLC